jgi:hypothetical protein
MPQAGRAERGIVQQRPIIVSDVKSSTGRLLAGPDHQLGELRRFCAIAASVNRPVRRVGRGTEGGQASGFA